MNSFNVINQLSKDIDQKKTVACITIISNTGSTPRDSGSKMLVYPDGSIYGTIGGGKMEKILIDEARKCIKENKNKRVSLNLTPSGIDALCMGSIEFLIEVYSWPVKVVLLGAGHVSKAIAFLLDFLSIPYIVCDERKDFANKENFPGAIDIINDLPHKAIDKVEINENTYIVIATYGHILDKQCLEKAIKTKSGYIGMIGSKSKVNEIFKELNRKKIYPQNDKRVYSPIGINTGGKTPQEIALSVVSEIMIVCNKKKLSHMRDIIC